MKCVFVNKTRDATWKQYYSVLNILAEKTLQQLKISDEVCVSVILVKTKKIHEINKEYRNIDRSTDVISFALCDSEDQYDYPEEIRELGDIFINVDAVIEQAKDYDHSIEREFCFLFIHGLLHCLGFDHMNKKDETKMFKLQKQILDPVVPG